MLSVPSIVPAAGSETVYLVLGDFGPLGRAYHEADPADADLDSVIRGLLASQFTRPVQVVAFDIAEEWAADVSEDIARELQRLADLDDLPLSPDVQAFVDRHTDRQLSLQLSE